MSIEKRERSRSPHPLTLEKSVPARVGTRVCAARPAGPSRLRFWMLTTITARHAPTMPPLFPARQQTPCLRAGRTPHSLIRLVLTALLAAPPPPLASCGCPLAQGGPANAPWVHPCIHSFLLHLPLPTLVRFPRALCRARPRWAPPRVCDEKRRFRC
jgi:hypothetical protein